MLKRLVFNLLLVVTAIILVVKPLIGFNLYHRAKLLAADEFITVIKAFSKRKQDYVGDLETECNFAYQRGNQNSIQPALSHLFLEYACCAIAYLLGKVLLASRANKSAAPPKLYLLHRYLAL